MKPKAPTEEQVFFLSNNFTYKLRPDLLINEHGRFEYTVIELIFPNKKFICGSIYKHPDMNIKDLMNNEYLTTLLATILQEEKTCLLMGNFNINLLNTDTEANGSKFCYILSSNFFAPYILQPTRLAKILKPSLITFFKFN